MDLNALRRICYGMYIVGSCRNGHLNGQVANTVFQITSEPPTVAVSINKTNLTHDLISASRVFSASVLVETTPLPFIGRFGFKSGREVDKLQGINYRNGQTGAPLVLDHTNACLEAEVTLEVDAGTHTIFVGRIVAAEVLNEDMSMSYEYYQKVKRGTTPKTAPSYIAK